MLTAPDLNIESLYLEAAELTGANPRSFVFREGCERLLAALDTEARLTAANRPAARTGILNSLVVQAQLDQLAARHAEIREWPVVRPVVLTGLLRSGTTLLHNLLALHPGLRAPLLWELMSPAGERGDDDLHERLAVDAQSWVDGYYRIVPQLRGIHPMDARRPDECHRLMANTFESMIFEARYRVPSYQDWLRTRDLVEPFRHHKRQLQTLLWRRPRPGRVLLKCPFHMWSLDALTMVYPDVTVIQLHRTPTEAIPSMCSLCYTMRTARAGQVDAHEIGRQWLDRVSGALSGLPVQRGFVPADRLLDVRYADLVADPVGTAASVCAFIGLPFTASVELAMRSYLDSHASEASSAHRYSAADFGLSVADLERRFAAYREEFGC